MVSEALEKADHSFSFGKNWENYATTLSEDKIQQAKDDLQGLLAPTSLEDKTFIDIGCGSGVHSVAAIQLGVKSLRAIDVDADSVRTTKATLAKYAQEASCEVEEQSIFDVSPDVKYDIVYSWGVLHHTGNMWKAIQHASELVKSNGYLAIAIYKKSPLCGLWRIEKNFYSRLPPILQLPITCLFATFFLLGILVSGRNPVAYVRNYEVLRGMNFWHDIIDWLGGYPYESATPHEIQRRMRQKGFQFIKETNAEAPRAFGLFGCGCGEYLFRKDNGS